MIVPAHYESGDSSILFSAAGGLDPVRYELVTYPEWPGFCDACSRAAVGIVVGPGGAEQTRRLARLRHDVNAGLVAVEHVDGLVRPHPIDVEGVVWVSRDELTGHRFALRVGMRRAATHGYFRIHGAWISGAEHLSRTCKRSVKVALYADPPIGTSNTLARRSGCGLAQLQATFRAETFDHGPKRLLQWTLMVPIAIGRPVGFPWDSLAKLLKKDLQRLRRTAHTLLDRRLDEVEADAEAVLEAFEAYFMKTFGLSESKAIARIHEELCA